MKLFKVKLISLGILVGCSCSQFALADATSFSRHKCKEVTWICAVNMNWGLDRVNCISKGNAWPYNYKCLWVKSTQSPHTWPEMYCTLDAQIINGKGETLRQWCNSH